MNKICPQCKEEKSLTNEFFYSSKQTKSGFRPWCKTCVNKHNKLYDLSHPEQLVKRVLKSRNRSDESKQQHVKRCSKDREQHPLKYRDTRAARKYGVPKGWYTEMLEKNEGRCEICGTLQLTIEQTKYLAVDHCHETGKVRGLLCSKCNLGLGHFKHSQALLNTAIEYLKKHN